MRLDTQPDTSRKAMSKSMRCIRERSLNWLMLKASLPEALPISFPAPCRRSSNFWMTSRHTKKTPTRTRTSGWNSKLRKKGGVPTVWSPLFFCAILLILLKITYLIIVDLLFLLFLSLLGQPNILMLYLFLLYNLLLIVDLLQES